MAGFSLGVALCAAVIFACGDESSTTRGAEAPSAPPASASTTSAASPGAPSASTTSAAASSTTTSANGWFPATSATTDTRPPEAHDGVSVGPPMVAVVPAASGDAGATADAGSKRDQIRNGSARAGAKPREGWEQFKHDVKSVGDSFK